jgi:hypothetical protein
MQFRVPQNIAMEDKIVGPLTAIQFGIVVIGWGFSFIIFSSTVIPKPVNYLSGLTLAFLTFVIAVGKFNDQPLYRFIRHIIYFIFRPKTRVWHKTGAEVKLITPSPKQAQKAHQHVTKQVSKHDIAQLALLIDSRGKAGAKPNLQPPVMPSK